MNRKCTFTTLYRRSVLALLLAATLFTATLFGQIALRNQPGLTLTTAAYGCQHSGGGGC